MKKNGSFSSFLTGFFLKISYFFSEVSDFFHSLPLVFLKTKDLIELNERHYRKEYILQNWEAGVNAGLFPPEEAFIRKFAQQECAQTKMRMTGKLSACSRNS